jgi:hypothetical protein
MRAFIYMCICLYVYENAYAHIFVFVFCASFFFTFHSVKQCRIHGKDEAGCGLRVLAGVCYSYSELFINVFDCFFVQYFSFQELVQNI